jgi:uncharacterized protein YndB with AHSA1/START domain
MTLLATLFPAYSAEDFDLEIAVETPKRLVLNWEQAKEWVEAEIREGRDPENEWTFEEFDDGRRRSATWTQECNEFGSSEEWFLFIEDVPFWKASK